MLRCDLCPSQNTITGLSILLSILNGKQIFDIYSKKVSVVIQPFSDLPIPHPVGAHLATIAGIRSYLYKVRGDDYVPKAFVTKSVVIFSLLELECSS